jgi:hypothetical protein
MLALVVLVFHVRAGINTRELTRGDQRAGINARAKDRGGVPVWSDIFPLK